MRRQCHMKPPMVVWGVATPVMGVKELAEVIATAHVSAHVTDAR